MSIYSISTFAGNIIRNDVFATDGDIIGKCKLPSMYISKVCPDGNFYIYSIYQNAGDYNIQTDPVLKKITPDGKIYNVITNYQQQLPPIIVNGINYNSNFGMREFTTDLSGNIYIIGGVSISPGVSTYIIKLTYNNISGAYSSSIILGNANIIKNGIVENSDATSVISGIATGTNLFRGLTYIIIDNYSPNKNTIYFTGFSSGGEYLAKLVWNNSNYIYTIIGGSSAAKINTTNVPGTTLSNFKFNSIQGMTVDSYGYIYVVDFLSQVIEKINPTNNSINVIAGTLVNNFYNSETNTDYGFINTEANLNPTGGVAKNAIFFTSLSTADTPLGIATDNTNIYFIALSESVILKLTRSGGPTSNTYTISTIAGTLNSNNSPFDPINAIKPGILTTTNATMDGGSILSYISIDSTNSHYYIASNNSSYGIDVTIAKVSISNNFVTILGRDNKIPIPGPATSCCIKVSGITLDNSANILVADSNNHLIEKISSSGTLSIIAGYTYYLYPPTSFSNGGLATDVSLNSPSSVAVDSDGNIYYADNVLHSIFKVSVLDNKIYLIAGIIGVSGTPTAGPATSSNLNNPKGIAVDTSKNIYIADTDNNLIEKLTFNSGNSYTLSIIAGGGTLPITITSSVTPTIFPLNSPMSVAVDKYNNIYIADSGNHLIEKISSSTGKLSVIAGVVSGGVGVAGISITNILGTSCYLNYPEGVAVDSQNNVYIADSSNNVIEKLTSSGIISIICNSNSLSSYNLSYPNTIASDSSGNIYVGCDSIGFVSIVNLLPNSNNNSIIIKLTKQPYPCFKQGSKILTKTGYKKIEELKSGDLIKTVKNGYVPIMNIGKKTIYHEASKERIKDQLYKCSVENYKEIVEDLYITGCHCILVTNFKNEKEKEETLKMNGDIYITDKKYRLPACVDERAVVYEKPGYYDIYHICLENEDYYMNYGIYANGLLVETCSKRYLMELSNMTLI